MRKGGDITVETAQRGKSTTTDHKYSPHADYPCNEHWAPYERYSVCHVCLSEPLVKVWRSPIWLIQDTTAAPREESEPDSRSNVLCIEI